MAWALKSTFRALPGDPEIESDTGYWIEELGAYIAADPEDADFLRAALGPEARIILAADLPPTP